MHPATDTISFGQYLRRLRKEQDLTQSALAEQAGCSVDTVKKIEIGVLRPSRQLAETLAAALQLDPAELPSFVRLSRAPLPPRGSLYVVPPSTGAGQDPFSPQPDVEPASPAPLAARWSVAPRLPVPPTSLVGREQEIEAVCSLLWREDVRLLTLTGPPGIGKTRLALQVASEMAKQFRHGPFFVNLAPIGDPELVVAEIAQAMGLREGEDRPLLEMLAAYLRDKQLLLVLDNFEQIIRAAPLITELLVSASQLKVLVTSRARLNVRGEHEFPVPPLSMPDPDPQPLAERISEYEAVRLFVDRAVAIKPDFELTSDNASAVAEICRRLDGLPLAIELAAARIKVLPPHALLGRLQHRLSLLTGGEQDLPERQRTLRGAIEWSYDLLDEEEKTLFRRLAVFQGGCTLEAIETVCAGGAGDWPATGTQAPGSLGIDVLNGVASLVDKSLLRQSEGVDGEPRFLMLRTIHEYAREKLAEAGALSGGEAAEAQQRHTMYFLSLAERAQPYLKGAGQQEWLQRLEQEQGNFRVALASCLGGLWSVDPELPNGSEDGTNGNGQSEIRTPQFVETGLRMVAALTWFWARHSHMAEGRRWMETAISRAAQVAEPGRGILTKGPALARALYGAGVLAYSQGDRQKAASTLEEALSIWRGLGDKRGAADTLTYLGVVKGYLDRNVDEGRALLEESVTLHKQVGDRWGLATAISFLGFLPLVEGDYAKARALFDEALPIFEALGDKWSIGWVKRISGEAARCEGDYATAATLYEQSLIVHRELGDRHGIAIALNNLGYVALHQGDLDRSAAYFRESIALFDESGSKSRALSGLAGFAGLALAAGELERAAHLFGAVEVLAEVQHSNFEPSELLEFQRNVAILRSTLDEIALAAAWREGRAMTWDQAITYALGEGSAARPEC